jgi:hypothetical protein
MSMFIKAEYYPGTNDSTYSDHGYIWYPAIKGGYYKYIQWIVSSNISGGFDVRKGGSTLIWWPGGGPELIDPNEPTEPPDNPVPEEISLTCKIYIGGISQQLIHNTYNTIPILGIDAPLIIGPKR